MVWPSLKGKQQTLVSEEQKAITNQPWSTFLVLLWLGGLAIAALSLWSFVALAQQVFQATTLAFDQTTLLWLHNHHQNWLTLVAIAITWIGEPGILLGICLVLSGALCSRRRWQEAIWLLLGAGGALGLNTWLKLLFSRARPSLWERVVSVDYYSFPSGHAMVSLVVYGLLTYWLIRRWPQHRWSMVAGYGGLVWAIGLSRLYLGVHWPTDVLAGYAAGVVWLVVVLLGFNGLAYWRGDRAPTGPTD